MNNNATFRLTYGLGFILIAVLLASAYFLQINKGISPCPLCMLQRIVMIALGGIFLVGALFKLKRCSSLMLGLLGFLAGASGVLLAGRQVWLQTWPPSSSGDCGASLDYMLHVLSIKELAAEIWRGGMECSQTGWEFFHLSLAAWSLIAFVMALLLVILQLRRAAIE